jgi:hypothetical protein
MTTLLKKLSSFSDVAHHQIMPRIGRRRHASSIC